MIEETQIETPQENRDRSASGGLDTVVVGHGDVWVVVGGAGGEDVAELLLGEGETEFDEVPVRVCRAVLDDGALVIGDCDPLQDGLLSWLMEENDEVDD